MTGLPTFAHGLCDDAAVFPPGLMPLAEAVPVHRVHTRSSYRDLVGPLVLAADALGELADLLDGTEDPLDLAVTAPSGPAELGPALALAARLPVRVRAVEVAAPPGTAPGDLARDLGHALDAAARLEDIDDVTVFVEVPRDERRSDVLAACAAGGYRAKFRTGGVRADLYPGEAELAAALGEAAALGVPFKATAGLHHAVRNTDPDTRFEQHGFLNLLLAAGVAATGAGVDLAAVLGERNPATVAAAVAGLDEQAVTAARSLFVSFGTCSIIEPLTELVDLGLVPGSVAGGEEFTA